MRNPFIPIKRVGSVILDGRADDTILNNLKDLHIEPILTVPCNEVHEAIAYHPDISLHPINHKTFIAAPNVYDYYKEIFRHRKITLIKGEKILKGNYPNDIAYNVARVWNYGIHNLKHMDEKLKYYLKKEGIIFINVKQGYGKCSTAIIDDKAIITSDLSIYKACSIHNIDTLLIKEGNIDLPGFNYGFIGGATGSISKNEFLFTGRIDQHPNKQKILNFLKKYNKKTLFLRDKNIIDIGSIIPLNCN